MFWLVHRLKADLRIVRIMHHVRQSTWHGKKTVFVTRYYLCNPPKSNIDVFVHIDVIKIKNVLSKWGIFSWNILYIKFCLAVDIAVNCRKCKGKDNARFKALCVSPYISVELISTIADIPFTNILKHKKRKIQGSAL